MPRESTPRGKFDVGEWEAWFAWYPVHLFGTKRVAWLRRISRRPVLAEKCHLQYDYSDTPVEHPSGFGLRQRQ
jgi:hypothetical protein